MRTFNNREKKVLKLLFEISNEKFEYFSFFLQKKYFKKKSNSALFLMTKQKTALLYIKKDIYNNLDKRKAEIIKFIEFVSLIQNLKENRYINIIPNSAATDSELHVMKENFDYLNQDKTTNNITLSKNGDHIKFNEISNIYNGNNEVEYIAVKLENQIFELILNNFMGLLFVSEELKEFVRNDFKSQEDIRYKKSQIATWVSIVLAMSFGLFGIYNPFEKDKKIELNSNQLDTLKIQLDHILIKQSERNNIITTKQEIDSTEIKN